MVIIALVLIPGIPAAVEFIRMQVSRRRAKAHPTPIDTLPNTL